MWDGRMVPDETEEGSRGQLLKLCSGILYPQENEEHSQGFHQGKAGPNLHSTVISLAVVWRTDGMRAGWKGKTGSKTSWWKVVVMGHERR